MAEVKVDTGKAQENVNNLQKEMRKLLMELRNLESGSEEFVKLSEKVGELQDKINDAGEAARANAGPAFERLGNNFGLVTQKLSSLDLGGAAESMKALGSSIRGVSFKEMISGFGSVISSLFSLGAALMTNPIFLLAGTLYLIATNLGEVTRWMKQTSAETQRLAQLNKDLNAEYEKQLGAVSKSVVQIEALTQAVNDHNKSEVERREALKTLKSMYPEYFKNIGDDINNTEALNAAKLKLIASIQQEAKVNAAKTLLEQMYAKKFALDIQVQSAAAKMSIEQIQEAAETARYNSETLFSGANQAISDWTNGTKGVGQAYNDLQDTIANIANLEKIANQNIVESAIDSRMKVDEQKAKMDADAAAKRKQDRENEAQRRKQEDEQRKKEEKEYYDWSKKELNKFVDEKNKTEIDAIVKSTEAQIALNIEADKKILQSKIDYATLWKNLDEKAAEEKRLRDAQVLSSQVQMASDAMGALMSLNEALQGDSEKSAKRAFKINKALSLAQAIMSTYQAVNAQLAVPQDALTGANFVKAGIALAAGIANVIKIQKTKFEGGGGGSSAPSGGGSLVSDAGGNQSTATPAFNVLDTGFLENRPAQGNPVQAYVLSSDVSSSLEASQKVQSLTVL
jgi:hypothetical protein